MKQLTKLLYLAFAVLGMGGGVAFAQQAQDGPPCPTSKLAPFGLAPDSHCAGTGCLVKFKNYQWWTAFNPYNNKNEYYNGFLGTSFAPEHVFVDPQGDLHLRMAKDWIQDNKPEWAGAEAVLMFHANGTQANLGYGDYLVTAEIVKPKGETFATYDPNVALGMFTYERLPKKSPLNPLNPHREIDLAEISRWGWDHEKSCPFTGTDGFFDRMTLCRGNAQFALQEVSQHSGMVKRYDIGRTNKITLVMRWRQGQVTFETYNGFYKLNNLPTPEKEKSWTTPPELKNYVPTPGCERFHINLWLGNYSSHPTPHPGPNDGKEVEVVIRNFEFQKR